MRDRPLGRVRTTYHAVGALGALVAMLGAPLLVACTKAAPAGGGAPRVSSVEAAAEYLLTSAAEDFRDHRPPFPARVRNVRLGYVTAPDGSRQYRLCGEFLPESQSGDAPWVYFATLQTSGYEQWLDSRPLTYCQDPSVVWLEGDYSSALQRRLDTFR